MEGLDPEKLAEEVFKTAEWYGSTRNYQAETFGLGWVAARHALSREEVSELMAAVNRGINRRHQEELAADLIQSAIRNVN